MQYLEKFIGVEVNTSGSYSKLKCDELTQRHGGVLGQKVKLYKFEDRFGNSYYISDQEVLNEIDELLENFDNESLKLYEYLYKMIILKFGAMTLIMSVDRKIARERDLGYQNGKRQLQKELRSLLDV